MALTAYTQQVQRLLNDEAAQFYNVGDLTQFINDARNDVSRQSECLINSGTLSTVAGTKTYALSAIVGATGYLTPINVRAIAQVAAGQSTMLEKRPWQWANNYWFNGPNSVLTNATITGWTQQIQGAAGSIVLWPTPNGVLTLNCDGVWYPSPLVTDATVEVIPEPWASAVPYFACYEALTQAQRTQDADRMMQQYLKFIEAARLGVTPAWAPRVFPGLKTVPSEPVQGQPTEGGVA